MPDHTDARTLYFPDDDDGNTDSWQVQAGEYADEPDLVIVIEHAVSTEGKDCRESVAREIAALLNGYVSDSPPMDRIALAATDDTEKVARLAVLDTSHADLRERIAQRIDQAWAEAKDRDRSDGGYRDGFLDGLEHAEGIAKSTPLTEDTEAARAIRDGVAEAEATWRALPAQQPAPLRPTEDSGPRCTCRHPVAAHRAGQWGACDYECGCQRITTEAGERCINCSSPTCDGEACAESPYQPRATTEAGEES